MNLLFFFSLMCALAVPIVAQNGNSVGSKVIAMEKAWNQAYKFRDKKALGEILHDSILLVNTDGSLASKSDFLASLDAAKQSDEQQAEPESISVHVFGDVAITTGIFREKGVAHGKAYTRRNRFVDTWMRKGDSWMCVAASATPVLR
jgi:ketosteroid isomerase-like protein